MHHSKIYSPNNAMAICTEWDDFQLHTHFYNYNPKFKWNLALGQVFGLAIKTLLGMSVSACLDLNSSFLLMHTLEGSGDDASSWFCHPAGTPRVIALSFGLVQPQPLWTSWERTSKCESSLFLSLPLICKINKFLNIRWKLSWTSI